MVVKLAGRIVRSKRSGSGDTRDRSRGGSRRRLL